MKLFMNESNDSWPKSTLYLINKFRFEFYLSQGFKKSSESNFLFKSNCAIGIEINVIRHFFLLEENCLKLLLA